MEPWERDGVKPTDDWSSLVFCRIYRNGMLPSVLEGSKFKVQPLGFIFVIVPSHRNPKYKMPGGHGRNGENPLETARREMSGETGLELPLERFTYVNREWKHHPAPHWSILFTANAEETDLPWMHDTHVENEGEVPKYLARELFDDFVRKDMILRPHLKRLEEAGLILLAGV